MPEEMPVSDASFYSRQQNNPVSSSYLIRLLKAGEIKGRKIGIWLVEKESLDAWLRKRAQRKAQDEATSNSPS
ncbi:MAG TPA: helix-turn-helix domain-containing protein [Ktedonobacterales bacterium]|nr:helix-turn-helix domain-containing protein [Ktedonobacterales bacterium]